VSVCQSGFGQFGLVGQMAIGLFVLLWLKWTVNSELQNHSYCGLETGHWTLESIWIMDWISGWTNVYVGTQREF